jgi:FkbM family methyltransferase
MRPGTFVELGAFDGLTLSNTLLLESCYNWTGLLIEASPSNYKKLSSPAVARVRRRSSKVHSAICAGGSGTVNFTKRGGPVSAQRDLMTELQANSWASLIKKGTDHLESTPVPCRPLSSIMDSSGLTKVDFLSLDVEGAEAVVLGTVDPSRFKIVMMEAAYSNMSVSGSTDHVAHELLLRAGLTLASPRLWVPGSRVYLGPDIRELLLPSSWVASGRFGRLRPSLPAALLHRNGSHARANRPLAWDRWLSGHTHTLKRGELETLDVMRRSDSS